MKVAVVGSGVAGLVCSWLLHREHEITVFEADDRIGGHVNTVDVEVDGARHAVDTGFIVFNERNYPHFCRILRALGVSWRDSDMGFGVRVEESGLEYQGRGLGGLFAQRRNLLRPAHWGMLREILRFFREARGVLDDPSDPTLGEFLRREGYSERFLRDHLVPMAAAVWSADPRGILDFPAQTFVRFFERHGFLETRDRPQWLTVEGGSKRYVERLIAPFTDRIRTATPVTAVTRDEDGVRLRHGGAQPGGERFDRVVFATHADVTRRILRDASPEEEEILGAVGFQENDALLHTDASVMPRNRRAWAAWNYHVPRDESRRATVTYWMNRLQGIRSARPLFVTLNRSNEVDPSQVLDRTVYHHPVFTRAAVRAQKRRGLIQGARGTWHCGAWWGYGFHEDGVRSALEVAEGFGIRLEDHA